MKKFIFIFLTVIISFLLLELILGYVLWVANPSLSVKSSTYHMMAKIYKMFYPAKTNTTTTYHPKSMYVPDKYLGYSNLPGSYTITLKSNITEKSHTFQVTNDENGNRITSKYPHIHEGKKELWIFGDSCTKGWGNNDETTFPYYLQEFLSKGYKVVNFADNGYGNIHAYLQLKRELEKQSKLPSAIVIVYGDYFNIRNVAAPCRLKQFNYSSSMGKVADPSQFLHPKGVLKNDKLSIEYVPLFWEFNDPKTDINPDIKYQNQVTEKILEEIYKMGTKNGAKMILAHIGGKDSDEVLSFAKKIGYVISDIRPDNKLLEWDDFSPFDGHPGPLAQDKFARKLYKTVLELKD